MKNVFFKIFNGMLDTAQSSVITWQTLKHVGSGGGISKPPQGETFEDK